MRDLIHSVKVAEVMREMALKKKPGDIVFANEMHSLGILHDIGYLNGGDVENHAVIGSEMLEKANFKYWKEVLYHGIPDCDYGSQALKILNIADMTVNSTGMRVCVDDRLYEMASRYGEDSKQYKDMAALRKELEL